MEACAPSGESMMKNASKAYRRAHPPNASTTVVPDIHVLFEKIGAVAADDSPKAVRNHLMMLLCVLTGRRASSLVRIWDHRASLRMETRRIDTPDWAREHRTGAAEMLMELGRLPRRTMADDEFVVISLRAYMAKTSLTTGQAFDPWIELHENRFLPRLCPVRAMARHLQSIRGVKISMDLRYDAQTLVTFIRDDQGQKMKAAPLLVSLNGNPRVGLQASTLNSRVKDVLLDGKTRGHITRACVASYRRAHGESISATMALGAWKTEEAFRKHYYRVLSTPVAAARLWDVNIPDWRLTRAHQLFLRPSLPPLDGKPRPRAATGNDAAIARALARSVKTRAQVAKRRATRSSSRAGLRR